MSRQSRPSIGGYTLERKLGQGGQGIVWQATRGGQLVALKIIDTGYDEEVAADLSLRLEREMEALQHVSHPAVIRVIEAGTDESRGHLYAAYELVDGQNVHSALRAPSPPSPDDCAAFVLSICEGLDAVHKSGIIHRDIKPGNIALRGDDWAAPVLLDFGLLRVQSDNQPHTNPTVTGLAVGTSAYIAHEVLDDPRSFSRRSDQWSLARVVLEVLTVALRYDISDFSTHDEMLSLCSEQDEAPHTSAVLRRALGPVESRHSSLKEFATAIHEALVLDVLVAAPAPVPVTPNSVGIAILRTPGEALHDYLSRIGCNIVADYRVSGGALWFFGRHEVLVDVQRQLLPTQIFFAKGGGRATGHLPAWWTKDPG